MATIKKVQNFVTKVLSKLNKSEKELQEEKVQSFVEESIIACETQIQMLKTSEIPLAKLELKKAENELVKADKYFEEVRFSMTNSFESYIFLRNEALTNIEDKQQLVNESKAKIKQLESQLTSYEEVLKDFMS